MKIINQNILKSSTTNKRITCNQTIKRFVLIALLLGTFSFIPNALFAQSPIITSFSPASGAIGSSVTISGTGFNATANQNIVFFGATQATVTAASTTNLTVTVPVGATYQNISVTNLAVNLTAYSAQPFIVTLAGNIAFANKQDFTTGTNPYSVSIGDIDGDGKSDLAVANYIGNTVSVFLNTSTSGTVSFAAKVDFTTGTNPFSVSIGDIDGDGKSDLAVANWGSSTISIFRNTSTLGFINFAAKVDLTTGTNPESASIGDIDGDGKPELVVPNTSSSTISIFRNTSTLGFISFATNVDFTTGTNPSRPVSIGDIDGDGKPDLAVPNYSSNTISVFLNTSTLGFIHFAAKVDFTTGTNPAFVNIGDIDGDGKSDLAVANYNSSTISVFRNTSTLGVVSFVAKVDFAIGANPYSISIGDIDGDGKPDLSSSNTVGNTVSVLRNTSISGTISFATKADFTTGVAPRSISIGDIDGDGKPDLVVTNGTNNTVSVIRQIIPITINSFSPTSGAIGSSVTITGTGFNATVNQNIVFFGTTQATVTAASTTSLTVTVPMGATFQNISVTNLAVNLTAYSAQPFIVTLAGNIAFANKVDFTTGSQPYLVSIGDIDGDGKPDLAVANGISNTISVFRNTSVSGTVSFAAKVDFATGSVPESASIGDIDGDGKPDLVVNNWNSNTISVLRNTSVIGTISFAAKVDFATGTNPGHAVSIGDIDGDGKPDLAVANWFGNTVSVFRNTSILGFVSFAARADFPTNTNPASATFGDIDGDGKPDLVVANHGNNNVSVFRNTSVVGTISFAAKVDFTTNTNPYTISMGDIDGDGKPDLAVTNNFLNTVSVLRNTSTLGIVNFAAKVDFTAGAQTLLSSIGDIDGDGKPDLAVTNTSSNTVSVFHNTSSVGTISFATKVDFTTGTQPYSVSIGDIDGDGKPDLAVTNQPSNVSIIRQEDLPQGSLTANGPFCSSGTGQLTWTATAGTGLFTVVYNDGVANYTVTNVSSGIPFNVFTNPVTSTITYSLVSVTYPNNATRTNGFTGPTATITINSAPTFTCPLNQTANTNAGLCTAAVSYSATSVIGSPAPTFTYSFSGATTGSGNGTGSGSMFNKGVTTVSLTVTNTCGTSTCSFSVTVTDTINPTITAPANINATTNTGCTATGVTIGTPTAADNCSVASVTNDAPVIFVLGNTIVTWTVTDGSGNTTTATQTVTVMDTINPTITAPANINATTNAGCTATGVSLGTPSTADNCSVASVINDAPVAFALGNTIVIWTVTDGSGNTTTATQTVTVTDNINPTITAPTNINATTNTGCTATGVSLGTPTTADNCSVANVINDAPAAFVLGNTIVTWTVTDGSANTTTATQTVTITDNINPTITAPTNINATTNAGCTATGVSLGTPTTADNCSVASVTNDAPVAFALGNTIVTWTVTDGSGNTETTTQTITVTDNINPTITAPTNINATTNTGCAATGVSIGTPTTADNCSVANVTNDAPATFILGNTIVIWIVTDGSGNTTIATQTVTVTDDINPTITAPVAVIFCNGDAITLGTPTTADNCGVASVTNDAPGTFPSGSTIITWTVADGSSNTATATQTITVNPLPNVTTNLSGATITSNQNGAAYQWLDCNNNTPITGETNQSYTATVNGNYAVVVTLNNCSDTSSCVNVNTVGIDVIVKSKNQFIVYPNPNNGLFTIQSTNEEIYSIINELGQTIQLIKLDTTNNYTVNIENLNNGIYFIIGFNNNQITKQKVVVTK